MNIVFDLGGVVVRWDPDAIVASVFADPAVRLVARREIFGHPDWIDLDRGTVSADVVIDRGARRTGLSQAEVRALVEAVPPSLVAIPETVALLYRLRGEGHALYCLSNMNAASIEHLEAAYPFWNVFTGRVISSRIRACKPDPAIYAHLLEAYRLRPSETIFIDDIDVNLAAAARFGIRTILFENADQCARELARLL